MKFPAKVSPRCHQFPRMKHLNRDRNDVGVRKKNKPTSTASRIRTSNKLLGKKTRQKLKKQTKNLT